MNLFTDDIKTDVEAQQRNRAWIEALRSGKYQQANGRLRSSTGYCCLGVACDLYDSSRWLPDGTVFTYGDGIKVAEVAGLPKDVMAAYCIPDPLGGLDSMTTLAWFNDQGKTFNEIADVIERELNEALAS